MDLVIVADNVRSIENTGALFRLADGVGAAELWLVGITPYPDLGESDSRRPWLRHRMTERLKKTALSGAEVPFRQFADTAAVVSAMQKVSGYMVVAEQTSDSISLDRLPVVIDSGLNWNENSRVFLVIGNEVSGVSEELVRAADVCVEIPMYGKGKSLNVAVAAGIMAYQLRSCINRL